jgi:ABC-type lipoprotein release transport system permease subunit
MDTDSQQNWTKKLEHLETEINELNSTPQNWLYQIRNWFLTLPTTGQIIIAILGLIFALSLLNTVFSLVRLLISLAIFSFIVYFIYNFFKGGKINHKL